VEQSDDTVAAVEADAMFPWFVISVPSVVLAVNGSGRAAEESENTNKMKIKRYKFTNRLTQHLEARV